jgi:hypothetical protein
MPWGRVVRTRPVPHRDTGPTFLTLFSFNAAIMWKNTTKIAKKANYPRLKKIIQW